MRSSKKTTPTPAVPAPPPPPTHEQIARVAYAVWEREGRPHGRAVEHWRQATAQLARVERDELVKPKPSFGPKRKLGLVEITPEPATK